MPAEPGVRGQVDLHVHTTFSDGVFTPEQVVEKALEIGLAAVSITDHDCVEGVPYAISAAEGTCLEVIPGVELSCARDEKELHILGYFIDHEYPELALALERMKRSRISRMERMIDLLRSEGVDVAADMVFRNAGTGTTGRMHLARVLKERGLVRTEQQAFDKYIGDGAKCHVKHERLDYRKAVNMILDAGGVPVLAHPGTMGMDNYIPELLDAGVRGIEVYHTKHYSSISARYLELASSRGLLVTGGSDCHGHKSGKSLIGKVKVEYEVVEKLREEAERIRRDLRS